MRNNCVHTPTASSLTVGCKAVRSADKNVVVYFDNITCNASILVLNVYLAVVTYCSNLVIPQVLAVNIVKAASFPAFQESHKFPC